MRRPHRRPPRILLFFEPPGTGRRFLPHVFLTEGDAAARAALGDAAARAAMHAYLGPGPAAQADHREAKERAWQLLQQFLTDEQKEQTQNGFVVEQGELGSYRIPLQLGKVLFESTKDKKKFGELTKFLRALKYADPMNALAPKHFHAYLCFANTGADVVAPWHDAVLTILLHIRAGNEKELWRKAGVTYMSGSSPLLEFFAQ